MSGHSGRHFLQIPGPTNVPDRVLRALSAPTIDHRGPEFAVLAADLVARLPRVFRTSGPVVMYPSSGTGAREAALVNTLSPGDRVLAFETGHFATLWRTLAERLGLVVELVAGDWRHGVDPAVGRAPRARTRPRAGSAPSASSTTRPRPASTSRVAEVRRGDRRGRPPALLLVDTISSLGSIDYRHDEWGVDVTVGCSQKGLMLPPGLGFNAVSDKRARGVARGAAAARLLGLGPDHRGERDGCFPYTPATNLLYGLREALACCSPRGCDDRVRPPRAPRARRRARAVRAWGLESSCARRPRALGVAHGGVVPDGYDADEVRRRSSSASTCRSARASAGWPAGSSASATSATSTTCARRRAGRGRDGAHGCGRPDPAGRGAGRDRPPRGDRGRAGGRRRRGERDGGRDRRRDADPRELQAALERDVEGADRFDAYTRHLYAQDASLYAIEPLGVAFPRDADDVAAAVGSRGAVRRSGPAARRGHESRRPDGRPRRRPRHLALHAIDSSALDPEADAARVQPGVDPG